MANDNELIEGTIININVSYFDKSNYSFRFLVESRFSTVLLAQAIAFIPDIDMKELKVNKTEVGLVSKSSILYAREIEEEINSRFGVNHTLSLTNKGDSIQ